MGSVKTTEAKEVRVGVERFRRVELPDAVPGRLYLHRMPGRNESLEDTWAAIEAAGVSCIVCLTGEAEIAEKSPEYARAVAQGTVPCERVAFPIADYGVPRDEAALGGLAERTAERLRAGERILVHCAIGHGRTGTFATCVVLALGVELGEARGLVRRAEAEPETPAQGALVERFAGPRVTA